MAIPSRFDTHEVFNQSPPYDNVDLFLSDTPLVEAVKANGGAGDTAALSAFGTAWGTAERFALARQANENPPKLHTFDAKGYRSDTVEFHPAYHELHAGERRGRPARLDLDREPAARRAARRSACAARASTWRRRSRPGICVRSP